MKLQRACAVLALCAGAAVVNASPVELSFFRITNNTVANPEGQLKALVSSVNGSTVSIKFTNNVGIQSSVSEIYFDDRYAFPFASIEPTLFQNGTAFTGGGANPSNLPGAGNVMPTFQATTIFSADAVGNPSNGISAASDWLDMHFTLVGGKSFQDVIDALNTGNLRIGLHVSSIGPTENSDSFVNNPPVVIPLPPAAWAGISCMLGLATVRTIRRRKMA
jgi:hypothetical protein